jgi:hypothetical protein
MWFSLTEKKNNGKKLVEKSTFAGQSIKLNNLSNITIIKKTGF